MATVLKKIAKWLLVLKTEEVRKKNIKKAKLFLLGKERFVG